MARIMPILRPCVKLEERIFLGHYLRTMRFSAENPRKIIHVDMDCFYAAVEIRDNPGLANKPLAVGGAVNERGVICTANYVARQFGIHSAMPTATALRQCKELVLLPVDMPKYRQVAKRIHAIFREFTDLVEPLALDEAYLDVTHSSFHQGSATLMAKAIREKIWQNEKLTASAGVAPNKFLAKIASGWKKPNGLFVIRPAEIEAFVEVLPVDNLFGVGKVTAQKLHKMRIKTCRDLQTLSIFELTEKFGKFGQRLYEQARGQDSRAVEPNRERKSLSVERTFAQDIRSPDEGIKILHELFDRLKRRIEMQAPNRRIKNQFIKLKFHDFKQTTAELITREINPSLFIELFKKTYANEKRALRLLGIGVHFEPKTPEPLFSQESLF